MAANSGAGDTGNLSQKILDTGALLLRDFIQDRVSRHASVPVTSDDLGGATVCDPSQKQLADCLRKIGDELDGNVELQRMIDSPQLKPTQEVFIQVACQIFSDGKFNWGRVVALFYLSCRLVIKALVTKIPQMIRLIIDWTLDYLREHLLNWIREQGGWEGIRSYFGTPTWQTVGVFLAGVLTTALVMRKM